MTAEVSALVVTWNSSSDIDACIQSLLASEDVSIEVIALDNQSSDATRDRLRRYSERITLIFSDHNDGYARGNNRALAEAQGHYVLLVNPDCVVEPQTLKRLVHHLSEFPRCGAASALLLNTDGSPQMFARREPSFVRGVSWFLTSVERWDRGHGGRLRARREYRDLLVASPQAPFHVDIPAAACVLLRREAVPGLFDERYPLFFNDVALYRNVRRRHWTIDVVPSAKARHGHGASHRQVAADAKRSEQLTSLRRYARESWAPGLPQLFDLLLRLDARWCERLAKKCPEEADFLSAQVRGTRGALGSPGGVPPFLST
jgi:GT2 family glycosyltransferase